MPTLPAVLYEWESTFFRLLIDIVIDQKKINCRILPPTTPKDQRPKGIQISKTYITQQGPIAAPKFGCQSNQKEKLN